MPQSPEELVEQAAKAAPSASGGRRCQTCALAPKLRDEVERATRHRKKVNLSWPQFEKRVLRPLGYPASYRALVRHMERCLGEETE